MGNGISLHYKPDVTPNPEKPSAFDPNFGFPNGRKERGELEIAFSAFRFRLLFIISVMIATEEEMKSAKLELFERDFCAHKLIEYRACRADVWPWAYKCTPERHDYQNCQYDEYAVSAIVRLSFANPPSLITVTLCA